jgi:hypothetical protein
VDQRRGALDQAEAVVVLAVGGGEAPLVGEEPPWSPRWPRC